MVIAPVELMRAGERIDLRIQLLIFLKIEHWNLHNSPRSGYYAGNHGVIKLTVGGIHLILFKIITIREVCQTRWLHVVDVYYSSWRQNTAHYIANMAHSGAVVAEFVEHTSQLTMPFLVEYHGH